MKKLTTEEFIIKAQVVHGNTYDYSKVAYTNIRNNEETFYKAGKTFTTVGKRFQRKKDIPYEWELFKIVEGSAKYISELENKLHIDNKEFRYSPLIIFDGMTECFKEIKSYGN